ncbi:MAG: T9SS type A sorting domain-containing protein [Chitinophagales bacterium]|nr:T9SS type A sorting domain-containing protein [Chitinophagales bacterium]
MSYRNFYSALRVALVLFITLCLSNVASAQFIVLYSRTVLTGQTYTPITGGTVINTNAGLSTGMSQNADDGSRLVNLPFTFTYDNNPFTQVTFCTNGWIGMGNQTTSVSAANGRAPGNLFTTTVPNNTIAAWFGDMSANFPAPGGIGSMVHGLVGTDVYAFEWRNATGSGFGSTTTNLINFMIKLYGPASVKPGRIEILYGTQAGALTTGRVIGIEDAVGGANRFINALNGSFTLTTTAGAWPGNGNGYRFDPPPPCTGTPSAGTITAPATVCPGNNFNLSLSAHSVGPGITYQWQSRTLPGGTFTNIAGATTASITTNTTVAREYRCVVTCTNSAQTSITPVVFIGINAFYICYCKTGLGGDASASIDSVRILETTLNNGSPGTAAGFYTQYGISPNTTASLQAGGLYTLRVKYGAAAIGSMWIDANQNNTFEASEWVQINTSNNTGTVVFRVPPTALMGLTGLRIRSATSGNGAANACTNNATGETEDYVITITPAPTKDVKVQTVLSPRDGSEWCPFKVVPAKLVIYNNGTTPVSGFTVGMYLTGPTTSTNVIPYTKTLAPFTSDTLTFPDYNFTFIGNHSVKGIINQAGPDDIPSNDTSATSNIIIKTPANIPIVRNDSVCNGEQGMLHVLPDGYRHNWYRTPTYLNKLYVGDTLKIPNLQSDTLLYVCSEPISLTTNSLTTTTAAGNGCGGGAMFNIIPNGNLRIDSFAALFSATGAQTVNVYYRLGTYAGNETNAGAWTLLGTANVAVGSTTALTRFTVNNPMFVTTGNTYGIYVNYNASYSNGTTTFSNADMTIQTGTGLCNQFGGTNAGRMFNGTVFYSIPGAACESPLLPIKAFVGQAPVVNLGPDIVGCEKQDIILDAGHFGATYMWNNQLQTQTINVKDQPGKYWVEVDRYCVGSDTVNVTLKPLPKTSGITYTRMGNKYNFTVGGMSNVNSILWLFGDGGSSIMQNPTHIYSTSGNFKVLLILTNDCGSDTTALIIPLGISNIEAGKGMNLYPNPATDNITLEFDNAPAKGADMMVVNSVGSTVLQLKSNGTKKEEINTSSLPAGNYVLKVIDAEAMITKPFVITR